MPLPNGRPVLPTQRPVMPSSESTGDATSPEPAPIVGDGPENSAPTEDDISDVIAPTLGVGETAEAIVPGFQRHGVPLAQPGGAVMPPSPPAHAGPTGNAEYAQAGLLTPDMLLHGQPGMFKHIEARILEVRDWVQKTLTEQHKADLIAEARLGNLAKRAEVVSLIDRLALQYTSRESIVRSQDKPFLIAAVIDEIVGLGPIEPLWRDKRITEVMVNGPDDVYVEIGGKIRPVPGAQFRDKEHLLEVCSQILVPLNRRVDQRSPLADARLPDGSRVNITHHAVAPLGPLLTIRRFPETVWTLADLVDNNSMSEQMACELAWLVRNRCSAVVIGGTGSGKTSLLNALSSAIPRDERVLTVEDSLELRLHPEAHVASLEARPADVSGKNEVSIRVLVKNALRMRPDRIIVGEVRDASALDMLQAMNTGHEGSMTTVHSNGAEEAVNRLTVLVAQGGEISEDKVNWLIGDAVDFFVVQRRYEDGSRRVQGIYEVPSMRNSTDGQLLPIPLWEWEQTGVDDNGKFVGEYVHKNDISDETVHARRLAHAPKVTIEEVRKMSELPSDMKRGRR